MSNGYAIIANEATYDTAPAAGWREVGISGDAHQSRQDVITPNLIRRNASAPRVSDQRVINKGATGTLSTLGFSNGLGLLLAAAAGTSSSGVVSGGTLAYEQIYEFDEVSPTRSISTEFYRDRRSGTLDAFTYTGGKVTQTQFTQDLQGHLAIVFGMDYASVERQSSDPARTPTIVTPDFTYAWPDALISIGPAGDTLVDECVSSFDLTLPTNLDVEDWCLRRGTGRHEPTRQGTPAPSGTINWRYQDPTYFDAFLAGEVFELTANWLAPEAIEDTTFPELTIAIAALRFTGEDPQIAADGPTTQNLPFVVLDNGTDPAATVTVITSDTAF